MVYIDYYGDEHDSSVSFIKREEIMSDVGNKRKPKKLYNSVFMNVPTEFTVIFIVMILVAFGIIMVYSSSFYTTIIEGQIQPYTKQILFSVIGFIVMYLVSKVQLGFMNKFAFLGYLMTIGLLITVFFLADDVKGAKRWIPIGGFNIQPSEVAKFSLIIVLALILTLLKNHLSKVRVIVLIGMTILIPIVLIAEEDLSAAIVVTAICGAMVFVAYKDVIKIMFGVVFMVGLGGFFIALSSYRVTRIKTYLEGPWSDPEGTGRQIIQSLYAIGSGGLTGIGLGRSIQKMGYISEAHNDIIFAIICEELGLLGGISIIGLFMLLIYRIWQISLTAKSMNHFLVGIGVMTHIAIQVFINIGVAINLIPTTGMPLPFISYGGSSLIMFMVEIGLVLNIARHNRIEDLIGGDSSE